MNNGRFDALTKNMGGAAPRRAAFRGMATALAGVAALIGGGGALAQEGCNRAQDRPNGCDCTDRQPRPLRVRLLPDGGREQRRDLRTATDQWRRFLHQGFRVAKTSAEAEAATEAAANPSGQWPYRTPRRTRANRAPGAGGGGWCDRTARC